MTSEKEALLTDLLPERDRMEADEAQFVKRLSLKEDCSDSELEELRRLVSKYPKAHAD